MARMTTAFCRWIAVAFLATTTLFATDTGAVTRSIAETSRVNAGDFIIDVFGNVTSRQADATDNQFQQSSPDNLNAPNVFNVPAFTADDEILVFGRLASGQDPIVVTFSSPFTVTLAATNAVNGSPVGGIQVTQNGTVLKEILNAFDDNTFDQLLFDSATEGLLGGIGTFEIRLLGNLNPTGNILAYDLVLTGFTEIPLPATLPLFLAALMLGAGILRQRR